MTPSPQTLKLASYNVHSWVGRDGRQDASRVVDVIRELDADVVALQETRALGDDRLAKPLAELCDDVGYHLVEAPTLSFEECSYGNALLSRSPVRHYSRIDLSVTRREPRGALAADIEHAGRKLHVVSTHLGLRGRERDLQVATLLEWIGAEVMRREPDLVSMMGDFNEWRPRTRSLRRIETVFGRAPAPRSFPSWKPWLRLDRIWVLPEESLQRGAIAHYSPTARIASDHLPVVAEIELPA